MKYSIIIPAHNEEANILVALTSIRRQSLKDYEIIVVCDSCTDKTEEISQHYRTTTIRVNCHNDGGARNAGIEKAQGEWLLFLDADDWWLHEFCLKQIDDKLKEEDTDILTYGFIWKYIGYVGARSEKGTLYPHCTNKVWKRSFIGDTRFPNKFVANDAGFHELMMAKNPKIIEWDMPIYYYNYLRDGSKSATLGRTVEHTKRYWSTH